MNAHASIRPATRAARLEAIRGAVATIQRTAPERRHRGMFLALRSALTDHWRAGGVFGQDELPDDIRKAYLAFVATETAEQARIRRLRGH